MPFRIDPNNNKCVQVKKGGKWKRKGCTDGSVKKYLGALYANTKDIKENEEEDNFFDWVQKSVDDISTSNTFLIPRSNPNDEWYIIIFQQPGITKEEITEIVEYVKNKTVWAFAAPIEDSINSIFAYYKSGFAYLALKPKDFSGVNKIGYGNSVGTFEGVNKIKFNDIKNKIDVKPKNKPNKINESDDDDWYMHIVMNPLDILNFKGKEIMIDIRELNNEELSKLYTIIKPHMQESLWFINYQGEPIDWDGYRCLINSIRNKKLNHQTISLHCGIEENDYLPLKGALCCLNEIYEDNLGLTPDHLITPINAKTLLSFYDEKNISESKKIIVEGRYDSITRKIVKDIMKVVKDKTEYYENEYTQHDLVIDIEVNLKEEEITTNWLVIAEITNDPQVMVVNITLGPKFNETDLESLFHKLQEVVRHEIEHFTQMGFYRIEDRPKYKFKTVNLPTPKHYLNVVEIPALVRGFYRQAKIEKKSIDEIMIDDLDIEMNKGNLTEKQAKKILKTWISYSKQNLPAAIYKFF